MSENILPEEMSAAVEKMIEIIHEMRVIAEEEAGALERRDPKELNELIQRKDQSSRLFERAGSEFHVRRAEFEGVDPRLLLKLKDEQVALQKITAANSAYYKAAAAARAKKKN